MPTPEFLEFLRNALGYVADIAAVLMLLYAYVFDYLYDKADDQVVRRLVWAIAIKTIFGI